jgi:NADPH:quinone reductase-like Zn-dependent oxidoreductase
MPTNTAAWLTGAKVNPLQIKSAPYTTPREDEIVIKNGAVAINPIDWMLQDQGTSLMFTWLKYPFILGTDVAGEVVEIGSHVTRFNIGDRVVGHAVGEDQKRNRSAECAFQTYTVLLAHMASPIPSTLSYESACVLPLGVSTAACGLFQEDQLALQHPSALPKSTGKTLLVWGGSTSVGSNAIQLAVAAGYEVFTTASPKNFDYVKRLGAAQVFDYNSKTVVADLIHAFEGKTTAGAISIGPGAADACMDVLDKCKGNKFISMASYPTPQPPPKRFVLLTTIYCFVSWSIANWVKSKARGIRYKFIFGTTLIDNGVGEAIYVDYLPDALAASTYIAAPEPVVVGKGLEYIQAGLDLQKKGMSAKKVVVSL